EYFRTGPQSVVLHTGGRPGLSARAGRAGGRHVADGLFRLPRLPRQYAESPAGGAEPGRGSPADIGNPIDVAGQGRHLGIDAATGRRATGGTAAHGNPQLLSEPTRYFA